jgi:hypothetical protein
MNAFSILSEENERWMILVKERENEIEIEIFFLSESGSEDTSWTNGKSRSIFLLTQARKKSVLQTYFVKGLARSRM